MTRVNKLMNLSEILSDTTTPPDAIIDHGILLDESLLLISGKKKVRKSFLAYNLAIGIAAGHSFSIFRINKPSKAIVLSAEGGYFPNRERMRKMVANVKNFDHENLIVSTDTRLQLDIDEDFNEIEKIIVKNKPKVLVIDPLVRFHSQNENSASSMSLVMSKIRHLIEDNAISIILVHHDGKSFDTDARGSSVILGEYDSYIQLLKGKNDNENELNFDMRHVSTPDPVKIRFNTETFWFENEKSDSELVNLIEERGPLTKKQIVDYCLDRGFYQDKSGAYKLITKETDAGLLTEIDGKFHVSENFPFSNSPGN